SGSGGFVGSAIVEELTSDHTVVLVKHRLEDVPNESLFSGLSAFIHCAHDFSARTERKNFAVNVLGSIRLLTTAVRAGVKKLIFISSVAAFDGCRSFYGRGKLAVENEITRLGGVSLRAGLVEGPGDRGLIGALRNVASLPAIPIFDGGKQPLAVVD